MTSQQTITITPEPVTRDSQEPEVFYVAPDGCTFVSPDGIGRFFYDSLAEAIEEHGDHLNIVNCPGWSE